MDPDCCLFLKPRQQFSASTLFGVLEGSNRNSLTVDSLILLGDFNAHPSSDSDPLRGVISKNGPTI